VPVQLLLDIDHGHAAEFHALQVLCTVRMMRMLLRWATLTRSDPFSCSFSRGSEVSSTTLHPSLRDHRLFLQLPGMLKLRHIGTHTLTTSAVRSGPVSAEYITRRFAMVDLENCASVSQAFAVLVGCGALLRR
jgi:hypothetical protein